MLAAGLVIGLGFVSSAIADPSVEETVRFLEQATFGPTPELLAHVQQIGFDAFLTEQFALPPPRHSSAGQLAIVGAQHLHGDLRA